MATIPDYPMYTIGIDGVVYSKHSGKSKLKKQVTYKKTGYKYIELTNSTGRKNF